MKINKLITGMIILVLILSCSKEETQPEETLDGTFLTFEIKKKENSTVLYSKWISSQFPTSSLNNTEFFSLPLIQNKFFNPEKDLIMVFGKRNTIFPMPVTIPQSLESYFIELLSGPIGTTTRIGVASSDLNALQNIFFRGTAGSQFRVIIIPSEKLLPFKSSKVKDYQKMTYQELADYFSLTE